MQACKGPVILPDRGLSAREVGTYWSADRTRLGDCSDRHTGLAKAVENRDDMLAGRVPIPKSKPMGDAR
jgi:hypothetical protein